MGFLKNELEEAESRGYYLPEEGIRYVCSSHFEDIYLKKYIQDHSLKAKCTYCKKKTQVLDLHEFIKYTAEKISMHFGNPGNEDLYLGSSFYDEDDEEIPGYKRIGSFVAPNFANHYYSTRNLLNDLDLVADEEQLNKDIEDCFLNDEWIQHHAYIMTAGQELSFMWKEFSNMVKHEQRFTFFKKPEFLGKKFSEDNGLLDILTELSDILSRHKLYKKVPKGIELYRCRVLLPGEFVDSFEGITSPPDENAKQSRMSPAGISMFYGAFDQQTTIIECGVRRKLKSIGKFTTRKDLLVLDLTILPTPSFWIPEDWEGIGFLHSFNSEITKPIERSDVVHFEYIPSQVFTEYLRYIYKTIDQQNLDGIIYRSSLKGAKKNIVLFYNQLTSTEILELIQLV